MALEDSLEEVKTPLKGRTSTKQSQAALNSQKAPTLSQKSSTKPLNTAEVVMTEESEKIVARKS